MVNRLTRTTGVLSSARTRSSGLIRGSGLGKDISEP